MNFTGALDFSGETGEQILREISCFKQDETDDKRQLSTHQGVFGRTASNTDNELDSISCLEQKSSSSPAPSEDRDI